MSELEFKKFRNPPVEIGIGDFDADGAQKKIKVSDIPYGKHAEFMQLLSAIMMRSKIVPKTAELFDVLIKNKVASGLDVAPAVQSLVDSIGSICREATEDERVKLLSILTGDQINAENVGNLQVTEVFNLLSWLIDRNLQAEKNFEASLNSTLNQNQKNT